MDEHNKRPLTEKEAIIAQYLREGHSREEIAELQVRSINTVNTHCKRMYRKLGVNNLAGLLKWLGENS